MLVDGMDLALADVSSLRRQIGVVLQDNMLFNRSIRENIALVDPGAPIEAVTRVAMLAGAHDFIMELPEAYDTVVGEHGASLSGGQRQRIAIARALMGNPRVLIFDEATSALDYESERVVQQNMKSICKGRTVIIIAHRLSAVRDANRIVVVDRGQIVEQGSHAELLSHQAGHYSRLYRLQQGGSSCLIPDLSAVTKVPCAIPGSSAMRCSPPTSGTRDAISPGCVGIAGKANSSRTASDALEHYHFCCARASLGMYWKD